MKKNIHETLSPMVYLNCVEDLNINRLLELTLLTYSTSFLSNLWMFDCNNGKSSKLDIFFYNVPPVELKYVFILYVIYFICIKTPNTYKPPCVWFRALNERLSLLSARSSILFCFSITRHCRLWCIRIV